MVRQSHHVTRSYHIRYLFACSKILPEQILAYYIIIFQSFAFLYPFCSELRKSTRRLLQFLHKAILMDESLEGRHQGPVPPVIKASSSAWTRIVHVVASFQVASRFRKGKCCERVRGPEAQPCVQGDDCAGSASKLVEENCKSAVDLSLLLEP